jgi:hypothetical protein
MIGNVFAIIGAKCENEISHFQFTLLLVFSHYTLPEIEA